jgi:transmembrane sensor
MNEQDHTGRLRTAACWYAQLQAPDASPDDWAEFRNWESDPLNAAAFREIERALSAVDASSLAAPQIPPRRSAPGAWWLTVALAAAALPAAMGLALLLDLGGDPAPQPAAIVHVSAIGEQRLVELPDGSSVFLNTASRIEVAYSPSERLVVLSGGQAFFEVIPGARPFIVEAAGIRTQAVGTAFDIRIRDTGPEITLVDGRLEVTSPSLPGAAIAMQAGYRLSLIEGRASALDKVDPDLVLSWRSGVLQFTDMPLADAAAELNRYSSTQILIEDAVLGAQRLSGAFPAGEPEQFASAVAMFLPVRVTYRGSEILISPASPDTP